MYRRDFLAASLAVAPWLAAGISIPVSSATAAVPRLSEPQPFSVGWLRERARTLGAAAYKAPGNTLPAAIADLGYDAFRSIRYRPESALWLDSELPFTAQFFHLGSYYRAPVRIHEVVGDVAREIRFSQDLFNYGDNEFEEPLPADLGFAGFRLHFPMNRPDYRDEVAVFLGASYFRAVGRHQQYGISARGLAIDTGLPKGEEFPAFREFWLERPTPGGTEMTLHALLDSPSLAGAYSFVIRPGETTVTEVSAALFPRQPVDRLGIAPMTSMYLFGQNDRVGVDDFRPQVHDSDGLSIWRGSGEWVWRPLVNPGRLRLSVFSDQSPRGFGLLQRERNFESYQDLEAHYERRPSLWIEPANDWGKGAVHLIEIPTDEEIHDNIVAFWVPEEKILPGTEWRMDYRLHWARVTPQRTDLAEVAGTRVGRGTAGGGDERVRKFVIDFVGGPLAPLDRKAAVQIAATASNGELLKPVAHRNPMTGGWRVFFDFRPEGEGPAELRCFLKLGETVLTESWSYQWTA